MVFIFERLTIIPVSTTLKLGPLSSAAVKPTLKPIPRLSPPEEQLVVLALAILKDVTQFYMYDNLQMQNIYDSGALSALHYILRRKDDIENPEIMTLGCQIVANVMQSLDNTTKKASLSQGDFMDALVELIEFVYHGYSRFDVLLITIDQFSRSENSDSCYVNREVSNQLVRLGNVNR